MYFYLPGRVVLRELSCFILLRGGRLKKDSSQRTILYLASRYTHGIIITTLNEGWYFICRRSGIWKSSFALLLIFVLYCEHVPSYCSSRLVVDSVVVVCHCSYRSDLKCGRDENQRPRGTSDVFNTTKDYRETPGKKKKTHRQYPRKIDKGEVINTSPSQPKAI